jgi:hypothetical protein
MDTVFGYISPASRLVLLLHYVIVQFRQDYMIISDIVSNAVKDDFREVKIS